MKRKLSYLIIPLLLLSTSSSCTNQTISAASPNDSNSTLEGISLEEEGNVYFYSHGDGTCHAYYIDTEEIHIPAYSPSGDLVVSTGGMTYYQKIRRISLPNTLREINCSGFKGCSNLESINIPTSLEDMDQETFMDCTSLKSITIPNNIVNISMDCFHGCTALEEVVIPEGCKRIESWAFYDCTDLKQVTFSNTLDFLGGGTFYRCSSLTSVTLPGSLTYVGQNAFRDCSNLSSIIIEDGVGKIYSDAFTGCPIKKIFIPKSVSFPHHTSFQGCPKDLVIYCEAESKPDNWVDDWNSSEYTVVWGAKREDVE